ncbi:histidine phosphatase family protein [Companilactobacillus hulinensis]|uniref:histidine phosphatase family protein n=1 Tax=Companilactobacillus hulinensis TaxID=2486007 RepID=UPI000F790D4C|nr:histidine phosphatase family protein [Companilactobacillus hulinensis]
MTEFYFIRHGQTDANAEGIKQGVINTDITKLNDTGKSQIKKLHSVFNISFADELIHSPLTRTVESAEILNEGYNLPTSTDERLLEISYGQWDGQKNSDLHKKYPRYFDQHLNDVLPEYVEVATKGETFPQVVARVKSFMLEKTLNTPDKKYIVVTHGFTIKAAALGVIEPQNPMTLPEPNNASVTKIVTLARTQQMYLEYYNREFKF